MHENSRTSHNPAFPVIYPFYHTVSSSILRSRISTALRWLSSLRALLAKGANLFHDHAVHLIRSENEFHVAFSFLSSYSPLRRETHFRIVIVQRNFATVKSVRVVTCHIHKVFRIIQSNCKIKTLIICACRCNYLNRS